MAQQPWAGPTIYGGQQIDPVTGLPIVRNPTMGMSPPAQKKPGIMDRLGGLLGGGQSYGGLLSEQDQKAAQRQALLAMGAQLMSSGGWSPQKTSFGQALGPALMAGQQAQRQAGEDMLQAMLLKTQLQKAKQTAGQKKYLNVSPGGVIFDPETGKPVYQNESATGGKIGNYNPGDYTPASWKKFVDTRDPGVLERYVTPANPTVQVVGGVPTVVQPSRTGGDPIQKPLSTLFKEMEAQSGLASSKEAGKQAGKLETEAKFDLPRVEQNVSESISTIRSLRDHPGLPYITGWASKLPIIPDTPQAAADALAKQIQGKTFLQAYQTLKGGGQITEVEGKKAEAAIARLERAQSLEDYQVALDELVGVLDTGLQRARSSAAAGQTPQPAGASAQDRPPLSSFQK